MSDADHEDPSTADTDAEAGASSATPPAPSAAGGDGGERSASGSATGAASPRGTTEAARELRNAVTSLKSAAGALFGNMQPAIKDVLGEADKVFQQAKATAKPAVAGVAEEAGRMVRQIGDSAEPLARSVGSELHKLSDVMAEAVDEAVKGARGAVAIVRQAADPSLGGEPEDAASDADTADAPGIEGAPHRNAGPDAPKRDDD
ncbi:MAG: hypothetical protein H6726_16150 [Sandaracinaceae bacterium]|nr:hypothetical protein [Myxococcales bacterium]MCB9659186.1 hypothetical protein [Sandaracinaceae bacterium]